MLLLSLMYVNIFLLLNKYISFRWIDNSEVKGVKVKKEAIKFYKKF